MKTDKQNKLLTYLRNELFIKWVLEPNNELDQYWASWAKTRPEDHEVINNARAFLLSAKIRHNSKIETESYNRILLKVVEFNNAANSSQARKKDIFKRISWLAAAVIILIALTTLSVRLFDKGDSQPSISDNKPVMIIKETKSGERLSFVLPDGSHVTLNSKSSIQYPHKFGDEFRSVQMQGEVYFGVSEDIKRPFIVKTSSTQTRVLGTSFNINSYEELDKVRITVVNGRVEVSSRNNKVTLVKGSQAVLDRRTQDLVKRQVDIDYYVAWKDGRIVFKDETLINIFEQLGKWYGTTFDIDERFIHSGCQITGEFEGETVENVLLSLKAVSAVTLRLPLIMALIRVWGIPISLAKR